jgi:hypothetical protein
LLFGVSWTVVKSLIPGLIGSVRTNHSRLFFVAYTDSVANEFYLLVRLLVVAQRLEIAIQTEGDASRDGLWSLLFDGGGISQKISISGSFFFGKDAYLICSFSIGANFMEPHFIQKVGCHHGTYETIISAYSIS